VVTPDQPASQAARPRVLLAFDGSDGARRALERVTRFMRGTEVAVVTVAPPIYRHVPYTGHTDPSDAREQQQLLDAAIAALEQGGIAATTLAPIGDPANEIIAAARAFEAELIVIGARAQGAVARLVLGSVSTKVVHESDCDVLVVK